MGVEGVSGLAVAATAGGALLIWSGIRGVSVLKTLGSVMSGQAPSGTTTSPVNSSYTAPADTSAGSASTGTATAPTNASESAFIASLLGALGAPNTAANQSSLASWFRHEFGSWPPSAANNPMATTQNESGATTFNSIGVKNYPNALTGVKATAATLNNGLYPGIVAALRSGKGLCGGGLAAEFSKWSGPGGYTSVC